MYERFSFSLLNYAEMRICFIAEKLEYRERRLGRRMEEGEAHAKSKLKSGKRQDRGGKKARGKTEAKRKQGKRKVEAR